MKATQRRAKNPNSKAMKTFSAINVLGKKSKKFSLKNRDDQSERAHYVSYFIKYNNPTFPPLHPMPAPVAQSVEQRDAMREVMSSTPARPTLRVLKGQNAAFAITSTND